MASSDQLVVSNKRVILKDFVIGRYPEESDMVIETGSIKLEVPEDSNFVLVKNLYLSCDPYMRMRMMKVEGSYTTPFTPGQVLSII